MAGLAIDGLSSGLDTTALINSLIAVEGNQQVLLKQKQSSSSTMVTALQALNSRVASLAESAKTAASSSAWGAVAGASSASSVVVTAASGAVPSTLAFTVDRVATSQSSLLTVPSDLDPANPTMTISLGGKDTTVTSLTTDPRDIAAAINASEAGVKAAVINIGTSSAPEYRLQLTGTETGVANAFSVSYADGSGTSAATLTQVRAADDAQITLFPGTGAAQTLTSASNGFSDVLAGVTITVSKVETEAVTVDVVRDTEALTNLAKNLVSNLGVVLSEIRDRSKAGTGTSSDGSAIVTAGLFSGDSAIRFLQQDLLTQASAPIDGVSPADVGIVISRDGTFSFDQEKFAAAFAADPARVEKIVSGVAANVQAVADRASDKTDGSITSKIKSTQAAVSELGDRISDWDDRLARRRDTLVRIYAALEVSMSKMQATSSWLTSQLDQLNASK